MALTGIARGWALGALLALLGAERAEALPMLRLDIDAIVGVGESFTVRVLASGIPAGSDGLGLFGFGFDLAYDPTAFSAQDPILGPLWSGTGFEQSRSEPGHAGLLANRFFEANGPFGDDILLGTVELAAIRPGVFALDLEHFSGVGDNVLFDATVLDGDPASFFEDAQIRVAPPVPSSSSASRTLTVALVVALGFLARKTNRPAGVRRERA